MPLRMQGGAAIVIAARSPSEPAVVGVADIADSARDVPVTWPELDELLQEGRSRWEVPVTQVGPIRHRLAEIAGARFVSVVPITVPESDEVAALVLLSQHRTLFHATDLELLSALGSQTAIVA